MANGNEFREYMKIVNRTSGNSVESHHLSEDQMLVYCRGEMSDANRELAQAHLLDCEQCIALFRNARDFLEPQRADEEEITATETNKAWQSLWEQVRVEPSTSVRSTATRVESLPFERPREGRSFGSQFTLAIAAALLIAVGAFGWQTWRLAREQQLRRQSEENAARLENSRRELEQQVSQLQQSGGDQLKLERERRLAAETERDQLQVRLNAREQASSDIPVYLARLSSERGAEDEIRLRFTGATEVAMLRLIIAKPYQFPRYTIELSDSGGKIVQKVSDLRPTGNDDALGLRVNKSTLRAGKYTLTLFGEQGQTRQRLGEHGLSVTEER